MAAGNGNRPHPEGVKYERKPVSFITTAAGMGATVTAMIIGSLFGTGGTLWGAALGSGVSATAGTLYENAARKTHARLRAMKEQEEADAHPDKHYLQARISEMPLGHDALIRARTMRAMGRRSPWKTAALGSAMMAGCFAIAIVTLLVIESASGRTLHSLTTGNRQYGTSFGYSTKTPAPSTTITIPASASASVSATISPSATASPSPDASPDATPDSTPDATPSPSSGSPTATGATP